MSAIQEGNRLFKKISVVSLAVLVFLAVIFITAFIIFSRYSSRELPGQVKEVKEEYIGRDFIPAESTESGEGIIVSINGNEITADLEIYKGLDMINMEEVFEKKRIVFLAAEETFIYMDKKLDNQWKKVKLELSDLSEGDKIVMDTKENLLSDSAAFQAILINLESD